MRSYFLMCAILVVIFAYPVIFSQAAQDAPVISSSVNLETGIAEKIKNQINAASGDTGDTRNAATSSDNQRSSDSDRPRIVRQITTVLNMSTDQIHQNDTPPEFEHFVDTIFEATGILTPLDKSHYGMPSTSNENQVTITDNAPESFPLGVTTITWTATDSNGNMATTTSTVTIRDTTAPVIDSIEPVILEAIPGYTIITLSYPTVSDIFPLDIINDAPMSFPLGTTVITWTVTDTSGNMATVQQDITIQDTTNPEFMIIQDTTFEATGVLTPLTQADYGIATATDLSEVTITNDAPLLFPLGVTTITWTATDSNGNMATTTSTVIIRDTTAPVIGNVEPVILEIMPRYTFIPLSPPAASDIFPLITTSEVLGEFQLGTTVVIWTVTDTSGNIATVQQDIIIQDSMSPEFMVIQDMTFEATGVLTPLTQADYGMATATDLFDVTITNDAPESFPLGVTTITWTATDSNGSTATATSTVTIRDTTAPVITPPQDTIFEATGIIVSVTELDYGMATATDFFDVTITNDAPELLQLGMTVITWTATDSNGNMAITTSTVTIRDTTAPVIDSIKPVILEAIPGYTIITLSYPAVSDIFPFDITNDAPMSFPLGTTVITWTVTDTSGNMATIQQDITIQDTMNPEFMIIQDTTFEATGILTPLTMADYGIATATDFFDVTITNDAPESFPLGVTTITWTATDSNGNMATTTSTVTIRDTTSPRFAAFADSTFNATAILTPLDTLDYETPQAVDIFDVTLENNAPESFPLGVTTITWTATDSNGNMATTTSTVTIRDTTAPVITPPQDATFDATGILTPLTMADYGTAVAIDIIDDNIIITSNATRTFPLGSTAILWSAKDSSGNSAYAVQIITIRPPNLMIDAPQTIHIPAKGILTWADLTVGATDAVTITHNSTGYIPIGNTTVRWTATDVLGNNVTADTRVSISAQSLDADWQYMMNNYAYSHYVQKAGQGFRDIDIYSEYGGGSGTVYLFKTFPKDEIGNSTISLNMTLTKTGNVDILVLDGTYSNRVPADFERSSMINKGGGILAEYSLEDLPDKITPNWSQSELDNITVMIQYERVVLNAHLTLSSVEFSNHSIWIFDDYLVGIDSSRRGSYVLVPDTPEHLTVHSLPITDTFDSSLDGWTFKGTSQSYTLEHSSTGSPSGSAHIRMDVWGLNAGISKLVDISNLGDNRLIISYDYRATSRTAGSSVTQSYLYLYDELKRGIDHREFSVAGGTRDTGWQRYTTDVTSHVSGIDQLRVVLGFYDSWVARHNQNNWFDNVRIYTAPSDSVIGGSANVVFEAIPSVPDEPIYITNTQDTSIGVAWNFTGTEYKVVIAPVSDPTDKTAHVTDQNEHTFVNLAPDTAYQISAGIRGDDSVMYAITVQTMPYKDTAHDISLRATIRNNSDKISLSWTDTNDIGENRYLVERSIDSGAFESAQIRPLYNVTILDDIRPDWLGHAVSYRIYERVGDQKIHSNEVQITLPDTLEPPQNLSVQMLSDGATILLNWEDSPIFRNYLVDRLEDNQWVRLAKIQSSSFEYPAGSGPDVFRVTTQLGSAESIPVETKYRPGATGS